MNYSIKPRKKTQSLVSVLGGVTLATILSACVTTSKVEEPILPTPATIEETTYSEKTTNNTTIPQDPLLERTWTFEGEENTREQYWEVALDQGGIAEKGKNWINDNGDILHSIYAIDDDLDGRADTLIEEGETRKIPRGMQTYTRKEKKTRKDYNFDGGRLITSDKVQLDPNFSGSIIINLTFYNKKTTAANKLETSVKSSTYKELEDLKNKVNFSFDNNNITPSTLDYPKKSNPF